MATMNHVNMNGANPGAAGGPMAMANGTAANGAGPARGAAAAPLDPERDNEMKTKLNTYIYDYLIRNEQWDVARALVKSSLVISVGKTGPARRPNGVDDNEDSKDDLDAKRPSDLPSTAGDLPPVTSDNSFLFDWFSLFWDIWFAPHASRRGKPGNPAALDFLRQNKEQNQARQHSREQLMRQPGMPGQVPPGYANMMRMGQQGAMGMSQNEMLKRASTNNLRMNPQQQMMMSQRMMNMQQMERAGSEMDANGRPRTPGGGENAPSPSKRQRIEGPQFGGQMMPNGRYPPGAAGPQGQMNGGNPQQAHGLLMQNGIDPYSLSQQQLQTFQSQSPAVQEKSIKVFANSFPPQGRPANMTQAMPGSGMMQQMGDEFFAAQMRGGPVGQNGAAANNGNHALQDYQMQLMLLERQNKKRLLMARQEQDNARPGADGQMPGGQGGNQPPGGAGGAFAPPNMSPQGSRSGPSPNPNDMKREDAGKMGQMGSPMPDGAPGMPHGRGSPVPMNFNGQNIPLEMMQKMQGMPGGEGQMPGGVRPPSSHPNFPGGVGPNGQPVDAAIRAQQAAMAAAAAGRMPNGANWHQGLPGQAPAIPQGPGGPAAPGQQPGGPGGPGGPNVQGPPGPQQPGGQPGAQQMGTPQQRAMPPPQNVPAGGNAAAGANARPASPATTAGAATPQTTNKPNPKKNQDKQKKAPKKKNTTTGATPMETGDQPPQTPQTPAPPMTPQNPNSFNNEKKGAAAATAAAGQASNPPAAPHVVPAAPAAPVGAPPPLDPNVDMMQGFNMDNSEMAFDGLNFGSLQGDEVFENLDFDALIHNGDEDFAMPTDFGYSNFQDVETQATDA